jgi:hypothetical protein
MLTVISSSALELLAQTEVDNPETHTIFGGDYMLARMLERADTKRRSLLRCSTKT